MNDTLKRVPGMMWAVWALVIILGIMNPNFAKLQNILNILRNTSILLILACGMTLAIVSRQLDLSIGGLATLAGMTSAFYIHSLEAPGFFNILTTIGIGVATGTAVGAFNGVMIGKFKYNYWLVTFSTMSISFALAQVITSGNNISGFSRSFRDIANSNFLGVPKIIWFTVIVVAVISLVSYKTRFGMHVYAVGDSEQCAEQSGIDVAWTRFMVYLLSGTLAGLGGVLLVARTNSASPISGIGYEFDAVAAVVVGGTPMDGGRGDIFGTVAGAVAISAIKSGLQLAGFSIYTQQVLIGLIILSIIVADVIQAQRKQKQQARRVYK